MTILSPISTVAHHLAELLSVSPSAVLSDFDGTLSAVAPTPDTAVIAPGAAESLAALAVKVDLVGIVTGRGVSDAMSKVGIPDLLFFGNHGLEWFDNGVHHVHPAGQAAELGLPEALRDIEQSLSAQIPIDGVIFENKRYSASIHYRLSRDPARTEEVLAPIVQSVAAEYGFWVSEGKMVVELRPGDSINKGSAVRQIVNDRDLGSVVFLGDDVTDADAFVVLRNLREERGLRTCSVGVLTPDTDQRVIDGSDFLLDGVVDVVAALTELAALLPDRSDHA